MTTYLRTFPFKLQPSGGPFDDPALLVTPTNQDTAILLDCGTLHGLKTRDLQKVRWLFLSHLHIDHLIGFDHLLRVRLFSPLPLTVYGPSGTVEALSHRLQGYAWNLTSGSPFVISVFDLCAQGAAARFACHERFVASSVESRAEFPDARSNVSLNPELTVLSHPVEHGVACLAYRLCRNLAPKFSLEVARSLGLEPGPWVKELTSGRSLNKLVEGRRRDERWLAERLLGPQRESCLGFLTDTRLTPALAEELSLFFADVDLLCCEAAYLQDEAEMAAKNLHMTTQQVAQLARASRAKELRLFHLSRRHQEAGHEKHLAEVRQVFAESYLLAEN